MERIGWTPLFFLCRAALFAAAPDGMREVTAVVADKKAVLLIRLIGGSIAGGSTTHKVYIDHR